MEGRHRRVFRSLWVGHAGTHSNKQTRGLKKGGRQTATPTVVLYIHVHTHYLNKQEQPTVKMDKQQVTVHRRKEHRYFQLKLDVQWKPPAVAHAEGIG